MKGTPQREEIKCAKCGKMFYKMTSGSNDISSMSFPVYIIQRYADFDSQLPTEINLCKECSDKLDRFLFIEEDGTDYYQNID